MRATDTTLWILSHFQVNLGINKVCRLIFQHKAKLCSCSPAAATMKVWNWRNDVPGNTDVTECMTNIHPIFCCGFIKPSDQCFFGFDRWWEQMLSIDNCFFLFLHPFVCFVFFRILSNIVYRIKDLICLLKTPCFLISVFKVKLLEQKNPNISVIRHGVFQFSFILFFFREHWSEVPAQR